VALYSRVTGRPIKTLLAVAAPIDERFHSEGQPIVTHLARGCSPRVCLVTAISCAALFCPLPFSVGH
jgi:hypothetical protein